MPEVIVYTCSHARSVAKIEGIWYHVQAGGSILAAPLRKCNGDVYRHRVMVEKRSVRIVKMGDK